MERKVKILPTLACADYLNLASQIMVLDSYHVDSYHIDIMDGNFVPNYCLNWDYVAQLRAFTKTEIDVHLMVENVERDIVRGLTTGIDSLAFHIESDVDIDAMLRIIRDSHVKAGLAISPETPIENLNPYLSALDYVIIMGVKPGFSGQQFKVQTYERISDMKCIRDKQNLGFEIWVDGGIDFENGRECIEDGADGLVAGALCIFRKEKSLEAMTEKFLSTL